MGDSVISSHTRPLRPGPRVCVQSAGPAAPDLQLKGAHAAAAQPLWGGAKEHYAGGITFTLGSAGNMRSWNLGVRVTVA